MILRPKTDGEIIAAIADAATDRRLSLDTRAALACLMAERGLQFCPTKTALMNLFWVGNRTLGRERINRIVREAIAAGYMVRAFGKIPRRGRTPLYSFIMGPPAIVAAFIRQGRGNSAAKLATTESNLRGA